MATRGTMKNFFLFTIQKMTKKIFANKRKGYANPKNAKNHILPGSIKIDKQDRINPMINA